MMSKNLKDALESIRLGNCDMVTAKVEYQGETYVVEVRKEKTQIESKDISPITLSSRLEQLLFGANGGVGHIESMPWLSLPPGYSFKVTFPFGGAVARFRVRKDDLPDENVSVYLDIKNVLGYFGKNEAYWEAYPIADDNARFAFSESKELIAAIVDELESRSPKKPVEFPATKSVEFSSGASYACDKHAEQLTRISKKYLIDIPVSDAPAGSQCKFCIAQIPRYEPKKKGYVELLWDDFGHRIVPKYIRDKITEGEYGDYTSGSSTPKMDLHRDLLSAGFKDLAKNVTTGKYDG